jgi:heat shock protein HtpX
MNHIQLRQHRFRNSLQTLLLMLALGGLCAWLAWFIGGIPLALFTTIFILFSYRLNPIASPQMAIRLFRGQPLTPAQAPELYRLLHQLTSRAGLQTMPLLFYLPSDVMNAFTTGTPRQAAIGLSDGLLRRMEQRELAAVLAHELMHIVNRDIRMMAFADLTSRVTSFFSLAGQILLLINLPLFLFTEASLPWGPILLLLFAPTLSSLVQLALSRNREYEADRGAAELSGDPLALASALTKMEGPNQHLLEQILLPGPRIPEPSLLRTHPPTEERIRRLQQLAEDIPPPQPLITTIDDLQHLLADRPLHPRWHRNGLWY